MTPFSQTDKYMYLLIIKFHDSFFFPLIRYREVYPSLPHTCMKEGADNGGVGCILRVVCVDITLTGMCRTRGSQRILVIENQTTHRTPVLYMAVVKDKLVDKIGRFRSSEVGNFFMPNGSCLRDSQELVDCEISPVYSNMGSLAVVPNYTIHPFFFFLLLRVSQASNLFHGDH